MKRNNHSNLMLSAVLVLTLAAGVFATANQQPAALDYVNINALRAVDPNLTGRGVLLGAVCRSQTYVNDDPLYDYRYNLNHQCLYDADVVFLDSGLGSGTSPHETAIAGILLGMDKEGSAPEAGSFEYRGICPDVSVNAHEFVHFSILNLLRGEPIEEDILLLSMGDMFELWWTRALESVAVKKDILIVASTGNGSNAFTPKPLFPAAGSNVLGVGVVDAVVDPNGVIRFDVFSNAERDNSSSGPTEDFRCKPDIVAPGTALVPSDSENDGYLLCHNWSSLSAPIVAGTSALLMQKGTTDPALKTSFEQPGKSIVIKSILLNSARKLPFWHKGKPGDEDDHETPLDYVQGAGMVDAMAAYEQLVAGQQEPGLVTTAGWDNNVLSNSQKAYEYAFTVSEPNQMVTATLCWNRAYQDTYPFGHLLDKDSDLRLELWASEPNDPTQQILLDYSDSVNDNVEHIYFAGIDGYSNYTIKVLFNEQQNPEFEQRFALAWSAGPDRQVDNQWWYDLNRDDKVDYRDTLIYFILNDANVSDPDILLTNDIFKVSPEQAALLTNQWPQFKPYLKKWTSSQP